MSITTQTTHKRSLKQRVIHAGAWTLGGHFAGQAIRLATNLITTRLLAPEMFGIMSVVTVIIAGIALFSDLGLTQNVVQSKRSDDPHFMNTVWTVQIIRAIIIWFVSLLVGVGFYIANLFDLMQKGTVYADPLLPIVIPLVTFPVIISALEPTWTHLASKNMEASKPVVINIVSQLLSVVVTITWAMIDKSIWALVAGNISSAVFRLYLTYQYNPSVHNHWMLEKSALNEIIHFGKWLFLSSGVGFLASNGDRILLGGVITSHQLGIYTIAYFMLSALTMVMSNLYWGVAYPALSEAATHGHEKLLSVYYKMRLYSDATALFISGVLFESGAWIVKILYDQRYLEAGNMLEILSIGLIAFRYSVAELSFMAVGNPRMLSMASVVRLVSLYVMLPIAFKFYGILGALWAIVISQFSSVPLVIYYKWQLKLWTLRKELIVLPIFLFGIIVGALINYFLSSFF